MIWILKKYRTYYEQTKAARLLGSRPEILREERLDSISRLLSTPDKISHLVIVRGRSLCAVALRYGNGFVPLTGVEKTNMVLDLEAWARRFEIVDPDLLENTDEMARLLRFDKILKEIRKMERYVDMLLPRRMPPLPEEIRRQAVPGDVYGLFSRSSYWWWKKRTGDLHILGTRQAGKGSACTFIIPPENGYTVSETTLLTPLFIMMIDCDRLRKLVIHEGITSFWGVNLLGVMDENLFQEVKLPHSLQKLERLNCSTEKMRVPRELKKLNLFALITMMGGRLDPVSYGVKKLILPAELSFLGYLPETEPIDYLEKIEIYGKVSDHDLNAWYHARMLNVDLEEMLDISYPSSWDRGVYRSYTEKVIDFIKKKNPDKVDWSAGHDMGRPEAWKEWTEEDYEDFRRHFHPMVNRREVRPGMDISKAEPLDPPLLNIGGYVGFGRYPLAGSGSYRGLIEWQVLAIEERRMLLLSRYALDAQPYHNSFVNVTWETCSLRRWLNEDFLNEAFSDAEKEAILSTWLDNGPGQDGNWQTREYPVNSWKAGMDPKKFWESGEPVFGSEDTKDKVFLLSCREVETFFPEEASRRCAPNAYAIRRGRRHYGRCKPESVRTWLRSPGYGRFSAAVISSYGYLECSDLVNDRLYVRPAIWVDINDFFDSGEIITYYEGEDNITGCD